MSCALGLDQNSISAHVERVGGGFGGKQTMSGNIAAAAAVAAYHLNTPVKLVLSRSQDMAYCPGRCPVLATYELAWSLDDAGAVTLEVKRWWEARWIGDRLLDAH